MGIYKDPKTSSFLADTEQFWLVMPAVLLNQ